MEGYFTRDNVIKEILEKILKNRRFKLHYLDREEINLSRQFFIDKKPLSQIAKEIGFNKRSVKSIKKKVLKPFHVLIENYFKIFDENQKLRNEIYKLEQENSLLKKTFSKENFPKKSKVQIEYNKEIFFPFHTLNFEPRLFSLLRNNNVLYLGRENCLILFKLENVRRIGAKGIKEIKKAIGEKMEKSGS